MDCLFCNIINKEIPSEFVYENSKVSAFNDIHPKANIHILIVPKDHIESIKSEGSEIVVSDLIVVAKEIARQKGLEGYKLIFNVGRVGGQKVDHLHLHLLSAEKSMPEILEKI